MLCYVVLCCVVLCFKALPAIKFNVKKKSLIFTFGCWLLKADFHSVTFIERAEFCDRFLLKCVQSAISNEIRST